MLCLCVGLLLAAPTASAADKVGSVTGYPLPRFVSIAKNEANLRTGPGERYPILTVLQRRSMPVKIVDEYGRWLKVELHDGAKGWLHKVLLAGRRTFLLQSEQVTLREAPNDDSSAIAVFQAGAIAHLRMCNPAWCAIDSSGYIGWVPRSSGWGVLANETFQ